MNALDLFSGIGGFRLAYESVGYNIVFSSEWDKFAQTTYEANFGERPSGDITKVESKNIPDFDVLLAGFPCQPFSIAGVSKKNALGRSHGFLDETQGTLFFDVARIIRDKKPRAFVLENVKNLQSHDNGRTFDTIHRTLKSLGYNLFYTIIDARHFVPQHRERIYIVGFLNKNQMDNYITNFENLFQRNLFSNQPNPKLETILEKNVAEKYTISDHLWKYLQERKRANEEKGKGFGFGLADLSSHSRTLSARYYKDGSEILIPQLGKNPRRLTPREAARLMGFPEDFKIVVSDSQAYKQFGNSVVVPVLRLIAGAMNRALS